jgi:hypothetical protein
MSVALAMREIVSPSRDYRQGLQKSKRFFREGYKDFINRIFVESYNDSSDKSQCKRRKRR